MAVAYRAGRESYNREHLEELESYRKWVVTIADHIENKNRIISNLRKFAKEIKE